MATIYYKVERDSQLGKKFTELFDKEKEYSKLALEFVEKHGFKSYRPSRVSIGGSGVSSFVAEDGFVPDKKAWKKSSYGDNEYFPRNKTKLGKEILDEINSLSIIHINDVNNLVGYEGDTFCQSHIGWNLSNKDYYGITMSSKWDVNIPSDCIEITTTDYLKLFPDAK